MTANHSPGAGDTIGGGDPVGRERHDYHSRRRLLETMTIGGAVALAGCNLLQSGPESNSDGENPMVGQTFRAPVEHNPARTSFYAPWFKNALERTFAVTPKEPATGRLHDIIGEPGVWTEERWVGGDTHYTWIEDISTTSKEVTVRIRDDATWSDGNPITGSDIASRVMAWFISNTFPPYFATEKKGKPALSFGAIDDFDVRNKSVTYRSSPGYFEEFWEIQLRRTFGVARRPGGNAIPTHIEPYDAFTEAVFQTARRALEGEINPWKGWDNPSVTSDDPHQASLIEKYLAKEGKYVAKFSKPMNVLSTSAWNLVEINGPEAVFEPNPHHRNAETVNFERLVLEYTPSEERARAALKADRVDYVAPGATPQAVVESLPETISQLQIPGGRGSGHELRLNFNHPALGNRKVRLALMYALDHSTITNNIHQSTALPVTTPGGDSWDATDYVSKEWIDDNLTTYTQNLDKATSLMRAAGYTRDGGQWIDANGEPLSLPLPTPSTTPRWEPTVASQLTEFGIQTSVKPLREGVFEARVSNGEFSIWAESGITTSTADLTLSFWYVGPILNPKVYGIYPKEQFETGKFSVRGRPVPRTQERYEVFTIEAPPIGQPDGPLQEYHPSALALFIFNNPPEAEYKRRVKTTMWLANWFLPTIPITKTLKQHFIDDAHWQWPTDTPSWQTFTSIGQRFIEGIFASGTIRANPDNPEDEAKQ